MFRQLILLSIFISMSACTGGSFDASLFTGVSKGVDYDFASNEDAVDGVIYVGSDAASQTITLNGPCSSDMEGKKVSITEPNGNSSSTICTGGTWKSLIDMSAQPEGLGKVVVKAETGQELEIPIFKDTTAPVLSLTAGLTSVAVNQSNQSAYPISGTCSEEGSVVTVSISGVSKGKPKCTNGAFSINADLSAVADGNFTITIEQKDLANNVGNYNFAGFLKDSSAGPVVLGLSNDPLSENIKNLSWSCNKTCTFRYKINNSATYNFGSEAYSSATNVVHSGTASDDGTVYYLHVQAQDNVGNISSVASMSFKIDRVAPTILNLASTAVPVKEKNWTWSCGETCVYRSVIDTNPSYAFTSEPFSSGTTASQSSGNGTYYLHVQAQDEAGNVSSVVNVSAVLDNTTPTVTGLSDDTAWTKEKTWNWSCSETCTFRYAINGLAISTFTNEPFGSDVTATQSSGSGDVYIHVQAEDAAGNQSAVVTVLAKIDTQAPSLPSGISLASNESTIAASPAITFTAGADAESGFQETQARIVNTSDSSEVVAWTAISSGATLSGSLTNNEVYKIELRSVDVLGNSSSAVSSATWTAKAAYDQYWSNVKLALRCEGGQIKEYISGVADNNNVVISSAKAKFGSESCYFNGTNSYLDVANAAFAVGTGDFTLEAWVYDINGTGFVSSAYRLAGQNKGIYLSRSYALIGDMQSDYSIVYPSPQFAQNSWRHIAAVRSSGTLTYYIDGVSAGSSPSAKSAVSQFFTFGRVSPNASQEFWNGYLEEARFTAGVARYTANFTPPTDPFPFIEGPAVQDPVGIADTILWLDGSDSSTITQSGGLISQWTDKASGRNFIQATGAKQPELDTTNSRLPLASVKFAAGNKYLVASTGLIVPKEYTFFMAGYWVSPNSYNALILQGGQNTNSVQGGNNTGYFGILSSSGYNDTIQTAYSGYYAYRSSASYNDVGRFQATITNDGLSAANTSIRYNGAATTLEGSAGTPISYLIDTIGTTDALYTSSGSFGEVILYKRKLSPAEVSQVETYLKNKWGTP